MNIKRVSEDIALAIEMNIPTKQETQKKGFLNSFKGKLAMTSTMVSSIYLGAILPVFAGPNEDAANKALTDAGITQQAVNESSLMADLQKVVFVVMGIGALWSVFWIIVGGMLLAGSGSNAQKRTGGMAAIGVACIGVYVIYKAYSIAAWAVSLGK